MIKNFKLFNERLEIEKYDEEIEEEEFEFASDGSVLYCFSMSKSGEFNIEERIVTTDKFEGDDYVYFSKKDLIEYESDLYVIDKGKHLGQTGKSLFVCYFNVLSYDIIKPVILNLIEKNKKTPYGDYYTQPILEKLLKKYKENIDRTTIFRKNMDDFKIKDYINNLDVGVDQYLILRIGEDKSLDLDVYHKIIDNLTDGNYEDGKVDIDSWMVGQALHYKFTHNTHISWVNGNINDSLIYTLIIRGDKIKEKLPTITRKYSSTKAYYTTYINSTKKSYRSYSTMLDEVVSLNKIKNVNLDEYF